ncbi:hypothetical protein [Bacteroides caecimuris]|uniref:hypothetical protein n=1 Tax=Bacteroides caecimuris TaxID=1796613 RepID=UPI00138EF663|nr:hypothetical protein [Bacteroides caecimuris]NDO61821.1 hypothetical protein [Bacteroides caecimuris]
MKNKRFLFLLSVFGLMTMTTHGENPPAKTVFAQYMKQAQTFADNFPREKAYLHFDNTSYYVGDTIWFKAYVTLAEKQMFSQISRPLYVELVDQTGHIADKQIIKLTQGEGNGQLVLPQSMLSGYYEVRAYTRWMLAFNEPQYFSRTFPIYQLSNSDKLERSITTYELNPSMENRPLETKEKLSVRFFPEGGQLVEGVTSQVAFKAESKNEGNIELSGTIYTKGGTAITSFETLHDGMGCFEYTPSAQPAVAKVDFQGKKYEFTLPQALPNGYVLSTVNNAGALLVKVSCNAATPQDTLAVFISHQRRPYVHQLISCRADAPQEFILPTRKLPAGVLQVSLINRAGNTLCERFVFANPRAPLQLSAEGLKEVYAPYAPIRCELQVRNAKGEPISGDVSVSIRDGIRSDYLEYDNNIFTDLLLTSDLKGYIHQPGYYFASPSPQKQMELDILLMVHGWRKYDISQAISTAPFIPLQLPEAQLVLNGQVKSTILKNKLKDIALSVIVKKDDQFITGGTVTDENGRFTIPVEDFEGTTEAVIQTRKVGKERNKDASILIDRNFSPAPRAYGYKELHPEWKDLTHWQQKAENFDSLYMDSIRKVEGLYVLDEVEIKSKRRQGSNMATKINEKSIDAYYDVRRSVDLLRDNGKIVTTIPELMEKLSPQFDWNRSNNELTYRQKPICYIMDNHILSETETQMMLTEVDGLASIIISKGTGGIDDDIIQNTKISEVSDSTGVDISQLDKYSVFYLVPLPRRDVLNKSQSAALGTRQTVIQGYTRALEYYSPAYPTRELYMDKVDKRRTLYWNPSVRTDANGKARIECYNNQYSTPLIIQAETMSKDGQIGSMTFETNGVD